MHMVHQDHHHVEWRWLSVFTLEFPTKTNLTNSLTQRSANQAKAAVGGEGGAVVPTEGSKEPNVRKSSLTEG